MAKIIGMEHLSVEEVNAELQNGAKFVMFEYCFSIIVMTFKRSSDIYFIRAQERTTRHSLSFTALTLVLGWWGFPWGPIYSLSSLATNFSGGRNVTREVLAALNADGPAGNSAGRAVS